MRAEPKWPLAVSVLEIWHFRNLERVVINYFNGK